MAGPGLLDTLDAAYDAGYAAGRRSRTRIIDLLASGYGDGEVAFTDRGSVFTLVPDPPLGDEARRIGWAVGHAHALEDLAEEAHLQLPFGPSRRNA